MTLRIALAAGLAVFGMACGRATAIGPSAVPGTELAMTGRGPVWLDPDGRLSLLGERGRVQWEFTTGATAGHPRLATTPGGLIYVRSDVDLMAFGEDGTLRWRAPVTRSAADDPGVIVRPDEAAIVLDEKNELVCIGRDGKLMWSSALPRSLTGAPAVGADSVVCAPAGDDFICVDSEGKPRSAP